MKTQGVFGPVNTTNGDAANTTVVASSTSELWHLTSAIINPWLAFMPALQSDIAPTPEEALPTNDAQPNATAAAPIPHTDQPNSNAANPTNTDAHATPTANVQPQAVDETAAGAGTNGDTQQPTPTTNTDQTHQQSTNT